MIAGLHYATAVSLSAQGACIGFALATNRWTRTSTIFMSLFLVADFCGAWLLR